MNNFENPKNLTNNEALNGIDQLAPKEELLNFKEKDEILDSLQKLKEKKSKVFSEIENFIGLIADGSFNKIYGQLIIADKTRIASNLSGLIATENKRLDDMENFLNEIKDSLGKKSVNN